MAAKFGRRLRRGAATSVVAALALAALTASQAPAAVDAARSSRDAPPAGDTPIDGGSEYFTDLPPLNSPQPPGDQDGSQGDDTATGPAEAGIPASVLAAYKKAEAALARSNPGCNLPWELLAAIGKVESGQARGGAVDAEGTTLQPILGPQLNGNGFARITDTDGGRYDGDTTHDRAVGPMQFIPSTWRTWGTDGNGDGASDPNNIYDAALSAGRYLCAGGRDLSVPADLDRAILGYNHSEDYLRTVLSWYEYYREGTYEVPDGSGVLPTGPRGSGSGSGSGAGDRDKSTDGKDKDKGEDGSGKDTDGSGSGATPAPSPGGGSSPGAKPGGGDGGSSPSPTPSPSEPAPLASLDRVGDKEVTAIAGEKFADPLKVRAKNTAGGGVAGLKVQYEVVGLGDTRFTGGAAKATVTTDDDGIATAPALVAGEKTGTFTVRATAVDRIAPGTDFTATVKEKQADALARTSAEKMQCAAKDSYDDALEVKATYDGEAVEGVAVTATMITDAAAEAKDPEDVTANTEGPYFKGFLGLPVRTLTDLKTGENGILKLPKIYTDSHTGSYTLRLTTAGGAVLDVDLKVG